jgi:hypothetical protein
MSQTKKSIILHPFFFAIFPVLFLFAHNMGHVRFSEVLTPAAVSLVVTLLMFVLFRWIYKDAKKAGIFVSIFVVLCFSHGHVQIFIGWDRIDDIYLIIIWCLILASSAFLLKITKRNLQIPTTVLNVVAGFLVVLSLINVVPYKVKSFFASKDLKGTEEAVGTEVDSHGTETLPDIYYIVLERYASTNSLREFYNFDNSEFVDFLTDKGFYVAHKSSSNYAATTQSLAASLNMEYVNYLSDKLGKRSKDRLPLFEMLQDYKVWRFLKSKGYKFIHMGSWWPPTSKNRYADINYNLPYTDGFSLLVYRTTMLCPIDNEFGITEMGNKRLRQWRRTKFQFDRLAEVPNIKEPVYVFAHMFITHTPYVFDREGNFLSRKDEGKRSVTENYVNQVIYTNKKLEELIEKLLSASESQPIIVLQADEGPYPQKYEDERGDFKWKKATDAEVKEKMWIFNAYYFPNAEKDLLYPSITPVNSFRILFNIYFNTNYELLPDRTYTFTDRDHVYDLFEVTDIVQ